MSPPSILKRHKQYLGPAFVALEAAMHIYLAAYLTLNWTNWPIWLFTVFEMTMFLYLLFGNKGKTTASEVRCEHGYWVADDCRVCDRSYGDANVQQDN